MMVVTLYLETMIDNTAVAINVVTALVAVTIIVVKRYTTLFVFQCCFGQMKR